MFYSDEVQPYRQMFFSSWEKYQQKQLLSPLEQQIVEVILLHPEYQPMLEPSAATDTALFQPSVNENPFLHMGLHLALREQISTDRPVGIQHIYQRLLQKHQDQSLVEHKMMDCLAQALWEAQQIQSMSNEKDYLDALNELK